MNAEPSFGQVVKPRRRELGLTQDELARRVGCAPVTIRKIEYDDLRPSVQIAERLAMALNIPLEERAAFVRLARIERHPEPAPTPAPAPEEIGIADLTGRAIRGYALGERIGAGGMGAVYRAVQPLVEREVAVKIILPQYANHPDFIRRFEAEAQLVARLEHPHIVPLYDFWREPSVAFLVMRLLRGGSVRNLLEKDVLPIEITLHIVEQVGSALAAAHRAGVIHRDLKPANILLDEDHNAYLADFGVAKNLSNPNLEDQTQMEAVIGSPDYISPEQIRSEFVRPQTDIYCLGVVLYELLTGHVPFAGPTPIEIMHQHLSAPLPPLAARRTGLPGALDAVIERATAKDPLERYPDVEEMLADLRRAVRGDVLVVRPLTAIVERPPLTAADNPYKGLRAFAESDAGDFFGRESLVQQLLVRMGEGGDLSHFLAVVGPSGSGKSSVVGAGLLPTLRRGALPGSDHWFIVEMMPGAHPLEELEAALLRIAVNPPETLLNQLREDKRGLLRAVRRCLPDDPAVELVLVIDQFEEVFTLVRDESVRAHLLDSLVTAVLDERSRIRVVITLRADFTDRPLQYVDFGELMRQRLEVVLPMTPDELERAILGPGERVGLTLESSLTSTIIRDVGDQPGALPLLQYALTELFEKREGRMLTKSAYQSIGGVLSALGRRAEEVFASLDEAGQSAARQLFLRLVTLGEGTEDTRRRVLRAELESLASDVRSDDFSRQAPQATKVATTNPINNVIEVFGKHRLLSFDRDPVTRGPTVEVAHEALLREWPHLREWLNESRADVRLQRQLANATAEWQSANRDSSFLLTGTRLVQFEGWAANTTVALTSGEQAYLAAGVAERDRREVEERERQGRELEAARKLAETEREAATRLRARNRVIAVAGGIALVLAALAGLFGLQSNQNADRAEQNLGAAQIANTQSAASAATAQAAGLLADEQRDVALNAEAVAQTERDRADEAAAVSFSRELAVQAKLNLTVDPERSILLVLAALDQGYSQEAENMLHEAVSASRVRLTLRGHGDTIEEVTYSPDGKLIATASGDNTAGLWDAATGQELLKLPHPAEVVHVSFSPDGKRLATGAGDGIVRIWDVASGKELLTITAATQVLDDPGFVLFLAFSPDGEMLATTANGESEVKFWDSESGAELFTLSDPEWLGVAPGVVLIANEIVFSLDGTRLAISLESGGVRLGGIEIWDMVTRQKMQTLAGRFDPFLPMTFSPDGTRLAAPRGPAPDERGAVWDVNSGKLLFSLNDSGNDILYSADGTRLLFARSGGRVNVLDAETGEELLMLVGHTGYIISVSESPGCVKPPIAPFEWCGTRLASASGDGTVRVWDISPTGNQELLTVPGSDFVLSEDGTRLSTVVIPPYNHEGVTVFVHEWALPDGLQPIQASGYASPFIQVDAGYRWNWLSPDGILVTPFDNGPFKFWDVLAGGKALNPISCCNWMDGMSTWFSGRREPRQVIGDTRTGQVMIWDIVNDEQIKTLQVAEPSELNRVYISPNGERLVTINFDTSVYIWDVAAGQKVLTLPGPATLDSSLWFSPDGKWLAIADCTGTVVVRDAASGEEKLRFSSTSACINAVGFSPDGKLFAVNAGNRGLKILDFETGQELLTLPGGFDVEFTPDGTRVISATIDEQGKQVVRMYLLRLEDIVALAKTRVTRSLTTEECQRYLHVEVCPEP